METYLTEFYYPWHTSAAEGARLSPRLKELVRLRIATLNGCVTCKAARLAADTVAEVEALGIDDYAGSEDYSASEKAAVWFAEMLAIDHHSITDRHMAELREHFDDGEIVELMMMAGQYIGFGRMLAVLELEGASCPLPGAQHERGRRALLRRPRSSSPTASARASCLRSSDVAEAHAGPHRPASNPAT